MKIPRAESKTVEFKTAFNQDAIVALVAFANAEGGDVFIGVRDDGKIVGVQLASESETAWVNEVKSKTAPAIVPEADRIDMKGKMVIRLHMSPLPVKPTSVQGRYYIRKGKANHLMSLAELSDLYLKSSSSSWDAMASGHSLEDISLEKVALFAKRMNPDNPDDPMRVLRKLSLVKDGKPTNACYLAFAAEHCSSALFMAGRFKDATTIIDSVEFSQDLFSEVDEVMRFIFRNLMKGYVITGKPEHDTVYDYPVNAIREIVLNMLIHRDYCELGQNTIKIFDDRIEFSNPGGLPLGLTVEALISDNYRSQPRNPCVAELFRSVGLIEQYGSGIKRILDACNSHGGVKISFEDKGTWFLVVLQKTGAAAHGGTGASPQESSLKSTLKSSLKSSLKILETLRENPHCTYDDLAATLGISRRAVTKQIQKLRLAERIRRVGPDKGGHWEVLDK